MATHQPNEYSCWYAYGYGYYNYDRDDNTSWVPLAPQKGAPNPHGNWPHLERWTWGKARSNRLSYRHTYARLHGVLKRARRGRGGPMMNNCNALGNVCRLDLLKHFDGTFSEGSALNRLVLLICNLLEDLPAIY